jgi:tetratricopeptide (TPR) repeat protein
MSDRLRTVWDFDDLDATEKRFQTMLMVDASPGARAEVLTQLARVHGLRGDFAKGEQLIKDAEAACGADFAAQARVHLERGRLRRSSGDAQASLPLFEAAFQAALAGGQEFIAIDAAHMAAIVAPNRAGRVEWTRRGMELAQRSSDPQVTYWLGPLLNNLGWEYFESGDYEPALDAFERALQHREKDPDHPAEIEIARYAVGKTLRALGQPDEAATLVEHAVAWANSVGEPDGWFHEELAEDYAALGRDDDAREHARLALPLLTAADPSFAEDTERADRLRDLAR